MYPRESSPALALERRHIDPSEDQPSGQSYIVLSSPQHQDWAVLVHIFEHALYVWHTAAMAFIGKTVMIKPIIKKRFIYIPLIYCRPPKSLTQENGPLDSAKNQVDIGRKPAIKLLRKQYKANHRLNSAVFFYKKTPANAGVFNINNNYYLTVVVALRFHFQTSSPVP